MDMQQVRTLIGAYSSILEERTATGVLRDIRSLPASKDELKRAFMIALRATSDREMRRVRSSGYVLLADFQELSDGEIRAAQVLARKPGEQHTSDLRTEARELLSSEEFSTAPYARIAIEAEALLKDLKAAGFA